MAKESMKAREVKRAKLVAKYAAKRAQLKAEGNYEALPITSQKRFARASAQPLQPYWSSQRIHPPVWHFPYSIP